MKCKKGNEYVFHEDHTIVSKHVGNVVIVTVLLLVILRNKTKDHIIILES